MRTTFAIIILSIFGLNTFSQQANYKPIPQAIVIDETYDRVIDSCLELNTSVIDIDSTGNTENPDNQNGRFYLTLYENSKMVPSNIRMRSGLPLECYATINNDTISIEGGKGTASGFGFIIKIYGDMFDAFYYPFSDEAIYKLKKSDDYKRSVDVPSKEKKLVLTYKPDLDKIKMVKGFLEISSGKFIENGEDGVKTYNVNLKVYFKCNLKTM